MRDIWPPASLVAQSVKNLPAVLEVACKARGGGSSLAGYSPWSSNESDTDHFIQIHVYQSQEVLTRDEF